MYRPLFLPDVTSLIYAVFTRSDMIAALEEGWPIPPAFSLHSSNQPHLQPYISGHFPLH